MKKKHESAIELMKALRHPVRRDILRAMNGHPSISPREISTVLGQPLSNISYHVRVLVDCVAIVLVKTKPVRGSLQHFYRLSVNEPWAREVLELED